MNTNADPINLEQQIYDKHSSTWRGISASDTNAAATANNLLGYIDPVTSEKRVLNNFIHRLVH